MLIVVGGHSRNIGKTSVVAGLIRALPQGNWTAMKITQFGHGVCSASGQDCDCCLAPEHPYAIAQERQGGNSDTGRFLAAGARKSYWVRTAAGQLEHAVPAIREILAASRNLIIESNSIMQFLEPQLYLWCWISARRTSRLQAAVFWSYGPGCTRSNPRTCRPAQG